MSPQFNLNLPLAWSRASRLTYEARGSSFASLVVEVIMTRIWLVASFAILLGPASSQAARQVPSRTYIAENYTCARRQDPDARRHASLHHRLLAQRPIAEAIRCS